MFDITVFKEMPGWWWRGGTSTKTFFLYSFTYEIINSK